MTAMSFEALRRGIHGNPLRQTGFKQIIAQRVYVYFGVNEFIIEEQKRARQLK